jgi:hypothetical protein
LLDIFLAKQTRRNKMILYFKAVFALAFLAITYGLLCPYLISAEDDLMVVLGFAICAFSPVGIYLLFKEKIKSIWKKED